MLPKSGFDRHRVRAQSCIFAAQVEYVQCKLPLANDAVPIAKLVNFQTQKA
jgi:hypothetical protein